MQKRWSLVLALLLGLALVFTACAPPEEVDDAEEPAVAQDRLLMATGGVGGTYYPLGGAIASVQTDMVDGVEITIQATGASAENMRLLAAGEAEIALAMNNVAEEAWESEGDFADEPVEQNWSAVGVVYPEIIQQFVAADSDIFEISDLEGYKVAVGPPGSGTEVTTRVILEAYGLTYDDIDENFATFADAVDLFKDGHIDAAFNVLAAPAAAIVDIQTARDIRFLEISGDALEEVKEAYPLVTPFVIEAGTYDGQEEDVETVALQAVMYVRDDLDEDLVYELTRALYEGQPQIAEAYERGDQIDLEKAADGVTTPFHPGAQRYLEEQGIL